MDTSHMQITWQQKANTMFFDDDPRPAVDSTMNLSQKIAVVTLNLLVLSELSLSLYLAGQNQAELTAIFLKSFFAMAIPTFIIAKVVIRRLGRKIRDEGSWKG